MVFLGVYNSRFWCCEFCHCPLLSNHPSPYPLFPLPTTLLLFPLLSNLPTSPPLTLLVARQRSVHVCRPAPARTSAESADRPLSGVAQGVCAQWHLSQRRAAAVAGRSVGAAALGGGGGEGQGLQGNSGRFPVVSKIMNEINMSFIGGCGGEGQGLQGDSGRFPVVS